MLYPFLPRRKAHLYCPHKLSLSGSTYKFPISAQRLRPHYGIPNLLQLLSLGPGICFFHLGKWLRKSCDSGSPLSSPIRKHHFLNKNGGGEMPNNINNIGGALPKQYRSHWRSVRYRIYEGFWRFWCSSFQPRPHNGHCDGGV